jgi:hypothetical protein
MNENNEQRVERARQAFYAYDDNRGTNVTDLLTDLMHYCQTYCIDFDQHLQTARMHYEEETIDQT